MESEREVSLAGCEKVARERAEAFAAAEGERLTARLRSARGDVSARAGEIERESPLFFGTGENPGLF
jgi:hypothetical protein